MGSSGSLKFNKVIGLYLNTGGLYGDYGSGTRNNFDLDAHYRPKSKGFLLNIIFLVNIFNLVIWLGENRSLIKLLDCITDLVVYMATTDLD